MQNPLITVLYFLLTLTACSSLSSIQKTDTKTPSSQTPSTTDETTDEGSSNNNTTSNNDNTSSTTDTTETTETIETPTEIPIETPSPTSCIPDFNALTTPVNLSNNFVLTNEPSGAVWHERLGEIITIDDDGYVTFLGSNGENVSEYYVGNDIEAITVANSNSDYIYIGVERLSSNNHIAILEYQISTATVTRTFDLSTWMHPSAPNSGLEALTFVPNSNNVEGGYFYAGMQENSTIYIFELPLVTNPTSTQVNFISSFTSPYNEISDLTYFAGNQTLYAIYDPYLKLVAMDTNGTLLNTWTLPELGIEGLAINPKCQWFFGNDSTGALTLYNQ